MGNNAATLANVSSSATTVQLFAQNLRAESRTVTNESNAILYLKFGTTASVTSYTVAIPAGGYYEFPTPELYTGIVHGIWSSANGSARCTEVGL